MTDEWTDTTHDWRATVDQPHLRMVADQAGVLAPDGVSHLLHEVLAYVADEVEAVECGSRRCDVALHADGSLCVRDYGRGTDIRRDSNGEVVRKPVMATKDLRFFDNPRAPSLPNGQPRRGMSVVAGLSAWLLHENRRNDGAWRQRYERGVPVEELTALELDGSTGTLVHFLPMAGVRRIQGHELTSLQSHWPLLDIRLGGST